MMISRQPSSPSRLPRADSAAGARPGPTGGRLPAWLLLLLGVAWFALAITPVSREDWLLENLLVLVSVPLLVATRHRLRFSNAAYVCLFVFLLLHSLGAHYTYSLVPYDQWWRFMTGHTLNGMLGWERNHFDRFVHFLYGALMLLPAVELLDSYARPRGPWRYLLPVLFVMSHSVIYEMMEWIAALVVAPDLGNAYLGTQGDEWDAQKDMALATGGAVLAMMVLGLRPAASTDARRDPGP
ncbi:MAG: hypothetical protein CMLOHMNK_00182 [Steroidobacteraceae bacterium]|nr:hypothetical protein [Steroidobacteraceae bacterium]